MDTTELHYLTYDPDEIWESIQDAYMDAGGDVLYPGDEKEMLLRAVEALLISMLGRVDTGLRMGTLRYAEGDFLDVLGDNRGCSRIPDAPAHAMVTVTLAAGYDPLTIPAGAQLVSDGILHWSLDTDITYTGIAESVIAGITCIETGMVGNTLTEGTMMQFSQRFPQVVSVKVTTSASGGMDLESDDSYRERIREWGLGIVTTGPEYVYESKARSAASEIIDAKAIKLEPGKVGIYLLLAEGTELETVKQAVLDACNPRDVRPLTDLVEVYEVETLEYNITVQYEVDPAALVSVADLNAAVAEYQAWQDNTIGIPFNPDRLLAELYRAGATRVAIKEGSTFNGGEVKYTPLELSQRCKGTIQLEVMSG